jgi:sporulation integral membrane protein YtvI
MNKEKLQTYAHLTISAAGVLVVAFILVRYLFLPLLPFLIAWGVAFIVRPAAHLISGKLGLPKRLLSALLAAVTILVGLSAVAALGVWGISAAWRFLSDFAKDDRLFEFLARITDPISAIFGDGEGAARLEEYLGDTLKGAISSLLSALVDILTAIVTRVPGVLFFILITLIAAVYFAIDLERINSFVRRHLPKRVGCTLVRLKDSFLRVGVSYIRSYLILMSITFVITLAGFLILRVKNALFLALVISLLDLLPLIGVGTVLVPWSIFQLVFGSPVTGVGLIVLLIVHEITRQFAEPRIVGKSLGLHPIVSLVLLYLGYSLFGFLGLFITPVVGIISGLLINKNDATKIG